MSYDADIQVLLGKWSLIADTDGIVSGARNVLVSVIGQPQQTQERMLRALREWLQQHHDRHAAKGRHVHAAVFTNLLRELNKVFPHV